MYLHLIYLCSILFVFFPLASGWDMLGLRKVMVRAHRQAWCWQDEWYGLSMEDIRQLELETQLALAKKMAQYSLSEEGAAETNGSSAGQDHEQETDAVASAAETAGDSLETRGELTKQWSTSSKSSNRSSKRGGEVSSFSLGCLSLSSGPEHNGFHFVEPMKVLI